MNLKTLIHVLNSLIIKIFKITLQLISKKSEGRGSRWKRPYSALICLLSRQSSLASVCPASCRSCQSIGARANAGAKLVTELKCSIGHGGKKHTFHGNSCAYLLLHRSDRELSNRRFGARSILDLQ